MTWVGTAIRRHPAAVDRALFVVVGVSPPRDAGASLAGDLGHDLDQIILDSPMPLSRIWPRPRPLEWPSMPPVAPEIVKGELLKLAGSYLQAELEDLQND